MASIRRCFILLVALSLLWPCAAETVLRVEGEGVAPFLLRESGAQDTTGWYDVETWLRHFPGTVEWDPEDGKLTYRYSEHWAALKAEPPFAVRDGRPLKGVDPPRVWRGRLQVSARFMRDSASQFLGRRLRVTQEGRVRHIVVDPGHGGEDSGSRGLGGALEKGIVLELARVVAERLRQQGFEVHLTRSADHGIGFQQRASVANYWDADLFLSIHASGLGRPQARGFEVFVSREPPQDADPRLWVSGQAGLGEASWRWAQQLRSTLGEILPTYDRGLGVIPNPVLEASACPACLVELGSLAWPQEAELLSNAEGQSRLADAIVRAAQAYFDSVPEGG